MVASSSVDNTVVVWNPKENRVVKVIEEQKGSIKGIAWDPIGKYIATHTGTAVRLWRVENWTVEHVIKEPFANLEETLFLKIE